MTKKSSRLKNRIKQIHVSQIVLLIVIAVLLIIIGIINVVRDSITSDLYDQLEGKRWSGDVRSGQVSLFFSESYGITKDRISEFEYNINKGLIADGYQEADANLTDGSAVWTDAYSAIGSIAVTRENRTVNAVAVGIGGDFFAFHPMQILSGNYLYADSVMKDYVMLDEDLAWQLFGSNNIVGETITLGGVPHYIAGVLKRDSGKYVKAAGLNFPTIYLSYESLVTYGTVDSAVLATDGSLGSVSEKNSEDDEDEAGVSDVNTEAAGIICMEVVMPNPVDNYARNFLIDKLGLNTTIVEAVDNSARYDTRHLLDVLGRFHLRGMQVKPLIYPYWENNARAYENILAVWLLVQIVCAVVAFILACIFTVQCYRHRRYHMSDIVTAFFDWKYDVESGVKKHHAKWKYF